METGITILRHGLVLTMDDEGHIFEDGFIIFSPDGIIAVGEEKNFPEEFDSFPCRDMGGHLIMPGMINTHTHLGMVSFRSLADDYKDRLKRFLMPLENNAMTKELAAASSRIAMAEMIRAGITAAVDMYYYEAEIAREADSLGFRLWAGETVLSSPHPGASDLSESFSRCDELMRNSSDLVTPLIAPHAPYSLPMDDLKEVFRYRKANGIGWTMHLEEMPFEMEAFARDYSSTPVTIMSEENLLDSSLIAAHLIFTSDEDINILSETGVNAALCPVANAKSAKGVAKGLEMMKSVNVTLGTDGPSSGNTLDLFTQMKVFAVLNKNRLADRTAMPASSIVPLVTRNAGKALGRNIGQLLEGFESDISVLSLSDPNMIPCYDPYSILVYSAQPQNVTDVYIKGKAMLESGKFTFSFSDMVSSFNEAASGFRREAEKLL